MTLITPTLTLTLTLTHYQLNVTLITLTLNLSLTLTHYQLNVTPVTLTLTLTLTITLTLTLTLTLTVALTLTLTLTQADVTLTDCTIDAFYENSTSLWTMFLQPDAQGFFEAKVEGAVSTDVAGNPNLASNSLGFYYDTVQPTVTITTASPTFTAENPITFTITFSEDVSAWFTPLPTQPLSRTAARLSRVGVTPCRHPRRAPEG